MNSRLAGPAGVIALCLAGQDNLHYLTVAFELLAFFFFFCKWNVFEQRSVLPLTNIKNPPFSSIAPAPPPKNQGGNRICPRCHLVTTLERREQAKYEKVCKKEKLHS